MRDALDFRRKVPLPAATAAHQAAVRDAAPTYRLIESFEIPAPTGRGFTVARGQIARFLVSHGPQIVDLDIFNAADPRERLWANQTLSREGFWLTAGARLWGTMPRFRPLASIVADTVVTDQSQGPSRHHHIFGAHCNPHYWFVATGRRGLPSCYDNLCQAIAPFGLAADAVHDNLNLFQKSRLMPDGLIQTVRSDAKPGDHVDFYAEIDLLLAASLCPRGSGGREPDDPAQERFPITVQILDTGVAPQPFVYEPAHAGP
jgi:uncharacterized protein YcgI (DUF1989 family)